MYTYHQNVTSIHRISVMELFVVPSVCVRSLASLIRCDDALTVYHSIPVRELPLHGPVCFDELNGT